MSTPRCTECGGLDLMLDERVLTHGYISQNNGKLQSLGEPGSRDLVFEPGLVEGVWATCRACGHSWKTRMIQITEHSDYEP